MPLEIQTIMKKTRPSAALVAAIMLLLCGIICLIPSCKKEKAPQVLSEPTSFDVPELVHVYGGYPFTLPIVTEPGMSKQCTEALKCTAPRARAQYST